MPRPVSGGGATRLTIKGTRGDDDIQVVAGGVLVNAGFKAVAQAKIDAGLVIKADAGNDAVIGGGGPDQIEGGADNDRLEGGGGLDRLIGGDGNDWFTDFDTLLADSDPSDDFDPNANNGAIFDGGRGFDTLDFSDSSVPIAYCPNGFASNFQYDTVGGHPITANGISFDVVDRVFSIEEVIGSSGNDVLFGAGFAAQTLRGGDGNDYVVGSITDDRLFGDAGNDVILSNSGNDQITGGTGNDTFVFGDMSTGYHDGHDVIFGFAAGDLLAFQAGEAPPVSWTLGSYNGIGSLVGVYDGGLSSITLVGVTSLPAGSVQSTTGWW